MGKTRSLACSIKPICVCVGLFRPAYTDFPAQGKFLQTVWQATQKRPEQPLDVKRGGVEGKRTSTTNARHSNSYSSLRVSLQWQGRTVWFRQSPTAKNPFSNRPLTGNSARSSHGL